MQRTILTWMFAGLLIGGAWAQSQPPSPTPGIKSQPPQTQAAQTNKNPDANRRGTEDAPFIVKVLPSLQAEQQPAPNRQDEPSKPLTDQRIADFTERLYYATAILAVIAFFQLIVFGIVFGWQAIQLGRTVNHLAISERAHVSGGANYGKRDDADVLIITVNNYGKTPTTIGTVAATVCTKAELANSPGW
jgi:hypothetical protein